MRALTLYRQDPAGIRAMQMAAVERIARYHTWEKVRGDYLHLYQQARPMSSQDRW
jgi:hypothetical protein